MKELIENINKINTTELGIIRIKNNLELETNDVVKWCKSKIQTADSIFKKGKNWYVHNGNITITINVNSYTIITANKMNKSEKITFKIPKTKEELYSTYYSKKMGRKIKCAHTLYNHD